jgi:hypothetical protein
MSGICYLGGLLLTVAAMLALPACSSTSQIRTTPPLPVVLPEKLTEYAEPLALLTVLLTTGTDALPPGVASFQFRINAVRLRAADGTWTQYAASGHRFEFSGAQSLERNILTARVPAVAYDSVIVTFDDLFLHFGPNAGGPLSQSGNNEVRSAVDLELEPAREHVLHLRFEPGTGLRRSADCHWLFSPVVTAPD